jgi:tetratricopeptide (TPR) repeat protein
MVDKLPTLDVVPVLATVQEDHATLLDLLPSEWEVLAAIDGVSDLRGIAASLGRSEFDVAKVVYGMLSTGVVALENRATNGHAASEREPTTDLEPALISARKALASGGAEEALRMARQVIAMHPSAVEARVIAARALRRLRRLGDASDELRRAIDVAPDDPGVRLEQGFTALSRGDLQSAVASWEYYLRLTPANAPDADRVRQAVVSAAYLRGLLEAYTSG